ncbi:MAG: HaeII family restriction endonuclease [Planctomycetes bacterium]|nr:HaeII family restriction endonuclease [Planctomycetota bacterium]MBU1518848.1 HaeII family restriction endonuclease [Planctomycetota bacterium]MBU2458060.1 HaeII family restriction endonuclease [Planctomycetota bacterium]MBU2596014.1 HaeII family restriction endonuclease [Planctomycetota bacterium]
MAKNTKQDITLNLQQAKARLDKLISKGRVHLYKPIQIAEILYRNRVHKDIDLSQIDTYRRHSTRWRNAVCPRLVGKVPVLNSRYEDQMFDHGMMSPDILVLLGKENKDGAFPGIVESYIYNKVKERLSPLTNMLHELENTKASQFSLSQFLGYFENDKRLKRSIDKIYEIIVYALFDTLTKYLKATVTLSVDTSKRKILIDFEKFANLVLGLDKEHLSITQPARLFRFGVTNAADTGLDMWANFGPAIQVKHITMDETDVVEIHQNIMADKIVIVCKMVEKSKIESIIKQLGLGEKIRGFITEKDLIEWYKKCTSTEYENSLGKDVIGAIIKEFKLEFPLTTVSEIDKFFKERGYSQIPENTIWSGA